MTKKAAPCDTYLGWNWKAAQIFTIMHNHTCVCKCASVFLTAAATRSLAGLLYTIKIKERLWKQKFNCSLSLPGSHYGRNIKENPFGWDNYTASLTANKIWWKKVIEATVAGRCLEAVNNKYVTIEVSRIYSNK